MCLSPAGLLFCGKQINFVYQCSSVHHIPVGCHNLTCTVQTSKLLEPKKEHIYTLCSHLGTTVQKESTILLKNVMKNRV